MQNNLKTYMTFLFNNLLAIYWTKNVSKSITNWKHMIKTIEN